MNLDSFGWHRKIQLVFVVLYRNESSNIGYSEGHKHLHLLYVKTVQLALTMLWSFEECATFTN